MQSYNSLSVVLCVAMQLSVALCIGVKFSVVHCCSVVQCSGGSCSAV